MRDMEAYDELMMKLLKLDQPTDEIVAEMRGPVDDRAEPAGKRRPARAKVRP
jgi:hypothetical protein